MEKQDRWRQLALISGMLLVLGYISSMGLEYSFLKWVSTAKGNWKVESVDTMSRLSVLFFFSAAIFSTLPAFVFVPTFIKSRKKEWIGWEYGVSMRDVIYYFALYQLGYVLIQVTYFIVDRFHLSLSFSEDSLGGIILSFLPQYLMAGLGLFLFYNRLYDIGFVRPVKIKQLLFVVFLCYVFTAFLLDKFVTLPVSNLFHFELDSWREQQISGQVSQAKHISLLMGLFEMALVGLLVPIAEEMMFRGVLQTALVERFGAWVGVIGSSLLFATIHIDPVLFSPLFSMALLLGWLRHHYRSLWASVLFHALNNTITVCIYFFR